MESLVGEGAGVEGYQGVVGLDAAQGELEGQ